ncbi:ABC transporter ATP-binding protein [Ferrimonas balearica]|uniref:ABC transporter ATP-binding protein n=1 Tax=Ferrimonas balearica TaxID=44012 RepID=UPI001C9A0B1E|nr:ABC transporter ATP-binding protein [Ferrimonas balearica]MBY5922171.1 ABC transporter ATP-binding protein [Ferrimonas balearica]MBY5994489.1 ABC transporter ATP-binding protein [Ferrimonas balearica]
MSTPSFHNAPDSAIVVRRLRRDVDTLDGSLSILKGVDLEVKRGESLAVIGPSGAGKSTLLALLAGLDRATDGEIWLAGAPLHQLDEEQRAALRGQKVGFIFQSFMLVDSLTALENVMLPLELAGHEGARETAESLLSRVGLEQRFDHFPNQLSGGEQQRVAIARAFATRPAILFADEPTGNLDHTNSDTVENLLFELNREQGTTLVLVTHDLKLAKRCQRQVAMNAGQLEAL